MILVVGDDDVLRNIAEVFLVGEGYEVRCLDSGSSAQDVIRHDAAAVSLVITALYSEHTDGRQMLQFVKKFSPYIPVVVFTQRRTKETADILNSGARAVINDEYGRAHESLVRIVKDMKIRRVI